MNRTITISENEIDHYKSKLIKLDRKSSKDEILNKTIPSGFI